MLRCPRALWQMVQRVKGPQLRRAATNVCVQASRLYSLSSAFDIGGLDDRPPFIGLRFLQGAEHVRRLLVARRYLLPKLAELLLHIRIGERGNGCRIELAKMSFGVPFGAHSPNQIDT